jgi:hypothetical protein
MAQKAKVVTCRAAKKNPTCSKANPAKRKPTKKQLAALAKGRKMRAQKAKKSTATKAKSNPSKAPKLSFKSRAKRGAKKAARKAGTAAAEGTKKAAVWTGKKLAKGGKRAGRKAWGTTKEAAKGTWKGIKKGWKENPVKAPKSVINRIKRLESKACEMYQLAEQYPPPESDHYFEEGEKLLHEAQNEAYEYGVDLADLGTGHLPTPWEVANNPISAAKRKRMSLSLFALPKKRKYRLDSPARNKYSLTLLDKHYKDGVRSKKDYETAYINIMVAFIKNGQIAKRAPKVKTAATQAAFKAASPLKNPASPVSVKAKQQAFKKLLTTCRAYVKQGRMTAANCKAIEARAKKVQKKNGGGIEMVDVGPKDNPARHWVGVHRPKTTKAKVEKFAKEFAKYDDVNDFWKVMALYLLDDRFSPRDCVDKAQLLSDRARESWEEQEDRRDWAAGRIGIRGNPATKVPALSKWNIVSNTKKGTTYRWNNFMVKETPSPKGSGLYVKTLYKDDPKKPRFQYRIEQSLNWKDIVAAIQEHGATSNPAKKAPAKKTTKKMVGGKLPAGCKVKLTSCTDPGMVPEHAMASVAPTKHVSVKSLKEASEVARRYIATYGLFGSNWGSIFGAGDIKCGNKVVARVAYNGTVWKPGPWKSGMKPLYDPAGRKANPTGLKKTKLKDGWTKTDHGPGMIKTYVHPDGRVAENQGGGYWELSDISGVRYGVFKSSTRPKEKWIWENKGWSPRKGNPVKGTPTYSNVSCMARLLKQHGGKIPNRVPATSRSSLKRCHDAGYLKQNADGTFSATAKGKAVIETRGLKANPVRKKTSGKQPAVSITLKRTEGGNHDLNEPHTIEGGDVWNKANVLLSLWGREAKPGKYNKVSFHIRYADGETYSGTYHVSRGDQVTGHLGKHIQDTLKAASGKKRPAHLTEAQYKQKIAKLSPTQKRKYSDFLRKYEVGCSRCK